MMGPTIYHFNLFLHIVAVALWLGLTLNFSLFMVPLIRDLPEELAETHLEAIGKRARRMVVVLMLVLVVTGLVNLHRVNLLNFSGAWASSYGVIAGVKISLALLLFGAFPVLFVLVHRYGSDDVSSRITRMNYLHWGISAVTLVIIFLGVLLSG